MIYCVEDDQGIRELMIYTLKASGFEARGFVTGEELMEGMAAERPQLILLDIMLPGEDGVSILQRLRASADTKDIPVIMASAKGTEYDKVMGLDLGADDYLVKPFGMMEMISRIRAVLRRSGTTISAGSPKAEDNLTNGARCRLPDEKRPVQHRCRLCPVGSNIWSIRKSIILHRKKSCWQPVSKTLK